MKELIATSLRETEQSETLLVNECSQEKEKQGETVYKFGFGQSPFYPPNFIIDRVKQEAHRKEYMAVQGHVKLREAVATFHEQVDQIDITADRVIVGPGSKMLIFSVMACFKKADVFLITPSWVSYEPQAKLAGHPVTRIQTNYQDRWRLTPAQLELTCQQRVHKDRPIIMVLNYPGNPDGLTYSATELAALAEVASRYQIIIISDEIYDLLCFSGKEHFGFGSINELKDLSISETEYAKSTDNTIDDKAVEIVRRNLFPGIKDN